MFDFCPHRPEWIYWSESDRARKCSSCGELFCSVGDCPFYGIDNRGTVVIGKARFWVCSEHWQAIIIPVWTVEDLGSEGEYARLD